MPAPATVGEFLELVRKSGVVDEARLDAYVQQLQAGSNLPSEPNKLAGLLVRDGLLTYFQAEQFLLGKWKRFTIGKYKVLERLGSGGMGQVFLCEHKLMRRRVAVKVLPTAKAEDPSSLERFYREARAVAALDHPNIVRAYDIDQDDNLHFLVMEYVDGASLQEIIKKTGPMDVLRACHYVYWSAVGLQHAHESGLIHRDIKPGNILVDRQGVVKILDMGLARFFHDDEDMLTKKYDESVLGTADYLAPEQALDSHTVDIRADIYSLGATFYFLLTGSPPFAEGTVAQKLIWHQTRHPRPVRTLRPEVPEGVVAIVNQMMSKDARQRYQTPMEVAEALAPWVLTPIPPPPDKEMPQLCAAAMGGGTANGPPAPPTRSAGPRTPAPAPRGSAPGEPPARTGTKTQSPPAGPAAGEPDTGSRTALTRAPKQGSTARPSSPPTPAAGTRVPTAPAKPAPTKPPSTSGSRPGNGTPAGSARTRPPGSVVQQTPPPAPPTEEAGSQLWESLADETSAPTKNDTDRRNRPATPETDEEPSRVRKAKPSFVSRLPANRRRLLGVGLGLLALFAVGVWALFLRSPRVPNNPLPYRQLFVTKNAKGGEQYATVKDAFAQAGPGDHIVLMDDVHEEYVQLSGAKGILIEPADGKKVVWQIPSSLKNAPPKCVLELRNADGVKVRGLTFSAQNLSESAVRVSGRCPGLTLEDLELREAKASALQFLEVSADEGHPAVVRRVRFTACAPEASAVRFWASTNTKVQPPAPNLNQFIQVRDCRIEGKLEAAFLIDGSATDLDLRQNRIWNVANGLLVKKVTTQPADQFYRVNVVSNTFHTVPPGGAAIRFTGLPAGTRAGQAQVEISQNLFVNVNALCSLDQAPRNPKDKNPPPKVSAPFVKAADNARTADSHEGNVPLNAAVVQASLPADPADPQFLRSAIPVNGPNGNPVGATGE